MRKIDISCWPRKEIYDHFSGVKDPFYMVSFDLDVTNIYEYAKKEGISFYYSMIYGVTKSINSVENFRYTIRDKEIYLLDERIPSFTYLEKDSDLFKILTVPMEGSLIDFAEAAEKKAKEQSVFLDKGSENDELIYISCLPWVDLTAVTNEGMDDPLDNIPRLCWGRIRENGNNKVLNISFEVNHRFIDGIHFKKFAEEFAALRF